MAWPSARRPASRTSLRDKVLRTYGVDQTQDSELQTLATDFLDQAVKDMNAQLYEFNKITHADITLVADTRDYTLTNTGTDATDGSTVIPYKESYAYLRNTNGTREVLTYLPWVRFNEFIGNALSDNVGPPELYTFRNLEADGKVSLHPIPSSSVATDYVLVLEFYRRIPLISSLTGDSTQVNVPEEVETPLIYSACKRLAIHLMGASHEDVAAFDALEQRAIDRLRAVDRAHPDQRQRLMLVDNLVRSRRANRRALYIRI